MNKSFLSILANNADSENKKLLTQYKHELDKAEQRIAQLDKTIQRLYDDRVNGLIMEDRFVTLYKTYEAEQTELKANAEKLRR